MSENSATLFLRSYRPALLERSFSFKSNTAVSLEFCDTFMKREFFWRLVVGHITHFYSTYSREVKVGTQVRIWSISDLQIFTSALKMLAIYSQLSWGTYVKSRIPRPAASFSLKRSVIVTHASGHTPASKRSRRFQCRLYTRSSFVRKSQYKWCT